MSSTPPGAEEILAALDPEQQAVARALTGPVCVLAGAGTGKTRAITHRIAYGVRTSTFDPRSVLAVTFTARAAGEMRTRLRQLGVEGVQARTFHSAALRQLSYFLPKAERRALPRLIEHKAPLVAQAAARLGLETDRAAIRDLSAEIEWAKVNLLTPDAYRHQAARRGRDGAAGYDVIAVSRLLALYEEILGEVDAMDFEDVLLLMTGLLAEHDDVAQEVRRQYRHFVIDEYQDVSPLQQRLLDLWLGGRKDVCVVGDPNQTIYSFTGADSAFLTSFPRRYPQAAVVHLVRDYRSTPQVVSLANSVLRLAGREVRHELVAQRPGGPAPRFTFYEDDAAEAAGVVRQIRDLIAGGTDIGEIAILVRTNAQTEPFEQELADAAIPYLLRGGERFFQRREVREVMVLLRAAAAGETGKPLLESVRDVIGQAGWTESPPEGRGAQRERWESLQAIAELAAGQPEGTSLRAFATEMDERAQVQHAPSAGGVTLASLHAAKGLEWDAVFLAGLSDGLVPISLAETHAEIEEERRLLYVGVTRARVHLHLSYAGARNAGQRASRRPSRFLASLWPSAGPQAGAPGRGAGGAGQRGPGSRGGRAPGPASQGRSPAAGLAEQDRALYDALVQWRGETAAAVSRPAFTVLHDEALAAIARLRPATIAQLAQIGGVGPVKLEAYGQEILALVEARH